MGGKRVIHIEGMGCENVDCIQLAQNGDQWQVFVNTAVNIFVFIEGKEFFN
jgi:hypothetical protein